MPKKTPDPAPILCADPTDEPLLDWKGRGVVPLVTIDVPNLRTKAPEGSMIALKSIMVDGVELLPDGIPLVALSSIVLDVGVLEAPKPSAAELAQKAVVNDEGFTCPIHELPGLMNAIPEDATPWVMSLCVDGEELMGAPALALDWALVREAQLVGEDRFPKSAWLQRNLPPTGDESFKILGRHAWAPALRSATVTLAWGERAANASEEARAHAADLADAKHRTLTPAQRLQAAKVASRSARQQLTQRSVHQGRAKTR